MITCRLCNGSVLPQLDLGLQPVCNRFLASPLDAEYKHPFKTGVCQQCGIMQLVDPFPAEELQPKVDWITYNEPEGHLDALAEQLGQLLPPQAFILGASFKDESTLERLNKKGFRTKRLEPAADLGISNSGAGVETIQRQLTVDCAKRLAEKYGKADAIIVRHILEHVYDIPLFLQAIRELITPQGYAVFEVPDCAKQFELLDYSTLWEEHLVYFTPETYRSCFLGHGFTIRQLDIVPAIMENSLLALCQPAVPQDAPFYQPSFSAHLAEEIQRVQIFTNSFAAVKRSVQSFFTKKKAAIFGAGHTSCLLINIMELPVCCVIDDNPHKKGLFTPGLRVPILDSGDLGSKSLASGGSFKGAEICVLGVNPLAEEKIIYHIKEKGIDIPFFSFCPASSYSLFAHTAALKVLTPEVFYGTGPVLSLDKETIKWAVQKSERNERRRSRICTHKNSDDILHEMIIVHPHHTYVRPHKHLGKPESLHVLEGNATIIVFDEEGNITRTIDVGNYESGKKFYYRMAGPFYHTLYITSDIFIFHETTRGPFRKPDTIFAPWSPEETDAAEVRKFMDELEKKVQKKSYATDFFKDNQEDNQAAHQLHTQPHTLVVGGTKGIGRTIARTLAERGHRLSVLGRSVPAEKIEQVHYWQADLEHPDEYMKVIDSLITENGPITHLIFSQRYRGEEDWDKEMAVDVVATKNIIEHLTARTKSDDSVSGNLSASENLKTITIISSIASQYIAEEQNIQYHVSKAALNQLVKYYALILGTQGIRVNAILPGTTIKEESKEFYTQNIELFELYKKITPLQRMGTANDVANVVAFLCSNDSSFITGQHIIVDGGVSLQGHESLARKCSLLQNIPLTQPTNIAAQQKCRLCHSPKMYLIIKLASTPIGDAYLPTKTELHCYPLDLYLCENCGLLQLPEFITPESIYRDYIYHTADSLGLVEHFKKYVESVLASIEPLPNSLVIEIGSNDGSALQFYRDAGMRVLGIDPAREIAENAARNGIPTLPEFFNADLAEKILAEHGAASIIMANNVLANIDDLTDIMQGIKILLAPEGVLVFETGYALDLIQKKIVDNIYHEHLSYFSIKPLHNFFAQNELQLIHVERVPTKGGSIRCTVQRMNGKQPEHPSVKELIIFEEIIGIHKVSTLKQFAAHILEIKIQLTILLKNLKAEGKSIAGYGASVGVTTILYALGLGDMIDFLVDDNVNRQDRYSPGLQLPVKPPEAIYNIDYVVILAWQYADPIIKKHQQYLEQGGKFIQFLPTLNIIRK